MRKPNYYISIRMKVLDLGTGEEMNVGETGELCFSGPQESWETELQIFILIEYSR